MFFYITEQQKKIFIAWKKRNLNKIAVLTRAKVKKEMSIIEEKYFLYG